MRIFPNWVQSWLGSLLANKSPRNRLARNLEFDCLEDRTVPATPIASIDTAIESSAHLTFCQDFTGDGKADVAYWSAGRWFVMESIDGERLADPKVWAIWPTKPGWPRFLAADFNGDGVFDIAGLEKNGRWHVAISDGTRFVTSVWESPGSRPYIGYFVGDFNGDNKSDTATWTRTGELYVALSTGTRFETTRWAANLVGRWTRILVGDFNGDGKNDFAGLQTGAWKAILSSGRDFTVESWAKWDLKIAPNRIFAGDFDGDHKTDVAWITPQGDLRIGISSGIAFDTTLWGTVQSNATRYLVGDFDADGDDDLATVRGSEVVTSYLDSGAIVSQQLAGWSLSAAWPYGYARDVDGDGKTDIAVRRSNGDWFFLKPGIEEIPGARFAYVVYRGEIRPYLSGAPWNPNNSRQFVDATPMWIHRRMDFNNRRNFYIYVYNFRYELRRWVGEARVRGLTDTPSLREFLAEKLEAKFIESRPLLESLYPGLTETKYRLLLSLNLAHGYYVFGGGASYRSVWALVNGTVGGCDHLAYLVLELAGLLGVDAKHYALIVAYDTPFGRFGTGHNLVLADGMLLDAEVNVAFDIGAFGAISKSAPLSRLPALLASQKVYGFYDWLNYPPVRSEQLSRNQDGGVLSWLYQFILGGFSRGATRIWQIHWRPT